MAIRYVISVATALVVTCGLFFIMRGLIAMTEMTLDDTGTHRITDFVRLRQETATQVKKRALPEKTRPEDKPKAPKMDMPNSNAPGATSIAVSGPQIDHQVDMQGGLHMGAAAADTDAVPVVRIEPIYPRMAAQRQIEGWVEVEFTISGSGSVKDPRVIKSEPGGVFDSAAVQAVLKWKYKPKIIDGKQLETKGVRVRLTFELD